MRRFIFCLAVVLLLFSSASAHSGGTDDIGGHYDNSTGTYHFHHGFSAHHHPGGVCPYDDSRLYPTDRPSRATQTTRPSSGSSVSRLDPSSRYYGWYERATATSTPRPTATPDPHNKMSVGDILECVLSFSFGGLAFFLIFIFPFVHDIEKKKKAKIPTAAKPVVIPTAPAKPLPPPAPQPSAAPAPPSLIAVTPADPTLVSVSIVSGYHTRIVFSNGETRYFDFLFLLLEERYSSLADYALFQDFHISVNRLLLYWDHFNVTIPAKRLYMESSSTPTVTVTDL